MVPLNLSSSPRGDLDRGSLSSYLFILYVEVFSGILSHAHGNGSLTRVPISRQLVQVSHLFFVDDCLLIIKASFLE